MTLEPAAYRVDKTAALYAICPMCKTLFVGVTGRAVICVHRVGPTGKLRHYTCKTRFARRVRDSGLRVAP